MSFSDSDIEAVWEKGEVVAPNDPNHFLKDACGAWMVRSEYGNRNSQFGWEVDHINSRGGNDLRNLRPLQWENNASKGDGPLSCPTTASGTRNVRRFRN